MQERAGRDPYHSVAKYTQLIDSKRGDRYAAGNSVHYTLMNLRFPDKHETKAGIYCVFLQPSSHCHHWIQTLGLCFSIKHSCKQRTSSKLAKCCI